MSRTGDRTRRSTPWTSGSRRCHAGALKAPLFRPAADKALALRSDGYRVLNLGADTPASALVAALRQVDDLLAVAVGVVNADRLAAATSLIKAVRRSFGRVPVVAGGAAIPDEETARRIGADGWAMDARAVGSLISAIAASSRKARQSPGTAPRRRLNSIES